MINQLNQVCEGDQVIVDVNNCLPGLSTSIHWHGIPMVCYLNSFFFTKQIDHVEYLGE